MWQAVELSPGDRAVYERVELQGRQLVSGFLQAGTLMHNYAAVRPRHTPVGHSRPACLGGRSDAWTLRDLQIRSPPVFATYAASASGFPVRC